jgi:hypothetical protein
MSITCSSSSTSSSGSSNETAQHAVCAPAEHTHQLLARPVQLQLVSNVLQLLARQQTGVLV